MEEKTLRDEIKEIKEIVSAPKRKKKFNLPFKAKISKMNLSKGYVTVEVINENKSIDFIKEPIIDGTIKLGDTFHAVDDLDIFFYKGKPLVHQKKGDIYSYNPLVKQKPEDSEGNTTFGQKYIMARMEGDKITAKRKMGLGLGIGALIIGAIIVYALFTGGA